MAEKKTHIESNEKYKRLKVNAGIDHQAQSNDRSVRSFLEKKRELLPVDEYVNGILAGNITLLSKAVTLIESSKSAHQQVAKEIVTKCLPFSGKSIRIGITGVPGVGKSTFIEALGSRITKTGCKLAVLAVDPSSKRSEGSILGDKTRMAELAGDKNAYIRPSPSTGTLGGVARKTRETIILCEAAGFDHIFIETVGVGQSETAVHSMSDFFLLLMLAGAGDELQGIKRGIMEMADLIAINKADGSNFKKADLARLQYKNALHMFPPKESGWNPSVKICSALYKTGIDDIVKDIEEYRKTTMENGFFYENRNAQAIFWMHETIEREVKQSFYQNPEIRIKLKEFEKRVKEREMSSFAAAGELLDIFFKRTDKFRNY